VTDQIPADTTEQMLAAFERLERANEVNGFDAPELVEYARVAADIAAQAAAAEREADDEGYEPFIAAEGWREDTSIRYVPESAVAEAVAAERDRCIRLAVERGAVYFAEPRPCTCKPGCAQVVSRRPFAELLEGQS
jgi:hypothetical protein